MVITSISKILAKQSQITDGRLTTSLPLMMGDQIIFAIFDLYNGAKIEKGEAKSVDLANLLKQDSHRDQLRSQKQHP